ncbi:hypothetical protein HZB08_01605 [Candidatus Saganbacteria bacterium]|uniref:Uncharacterized protein n=1 Tax=Candidatus Saganbacteria bacterium TaxID=2575572 RepID=A0A9D6UMK8_UNCSA|nr:hypothetical protein [Candidatus Saganbacteria bacterium]
MADIFVKIFQIVFAVLVVGMLVKEERFNVPAFLFGIIASLSLLTTAIVLYYNSFMEEGE